MPPPPRLAVATATSVVVFAPNIPFGITGKKFNLGVIGPSRVLPHAFGRCQISFCKTTPGSDVDEEDGRFSFRVTRPVLASDSRSSSDVAFGLSAASPTGFLVVPTPDRRSAGRSEEGRTREAPSQSVRFGAVRRASRCAAPTDSCRRRPSAVMKGDARKYGFKEDVKHKT